MRLLAKKMRDEQRETGTASKESTERMLERLSRAGDEARKSAQDRGKRLRAPRAPPRPSRRPPRRCSAAIARPRRKMLDEAAARAEAMEQERAERPPRPMAIAEMLEKSGALEQAIQMAMLGREGSAGEGRGRRRPWAWARATGEGKGGQGSRARRAAARAVLARLAAIGVTRQDSDARHEGRGPHIPDRHRAKRDAIAVAGIDARALAGRRGRARHPGDPAASAAAPSRPRRTARCSPRTTPPPRRASPTSASPRARRAAVRRYFQSIRPDQPERLREASMTIDLSQNGSARRKANGAARASAPATDVTANERGASVDERGARARAGRARWASASPRASRR